MRTHQPALSLSPRGRGGGGGCPDQRLYLVQQAQQQQGGWPLHGGSFGGCSFSPTLGRKLAPQPPSAQPQPLAAPQPPWRAPPPGWSGCGVIF